ncbi:hypothetical protein THIOKS13320053 [Thiocapsa sp. KS1]|nr:LapA family protein [Thiocapsa sp. KS1]CRI66981.1 hypothetical protein THIOKS13320053 [Thiocapsa sp. KS1]
MSGLESMLVGALITWVVAWFYYKRAGDELRQEAKHLKNATNAILAYLANPNAELEVIRDSKGNPESVAVGVVGKARGTSTANATGESKPTAESAPKGTQRRTKKSVT